MSRSPAIAVTATADAKLGVASATYLSIQGSCPRDCPMHPVTGDGSCYGAAGKCALHNGRLTSRAGIGTREYATDQSSVACARAEARAIDAMGVALGRHMRMGVIGDSTCSEAAAVRARAAASYRARGGGKVWAYTHAWRAIDRAAWGSIAITASIEDPREIPAAHAAGYAVACVVPSWDAARAVGLIPCPAQESGEKTCVRGSKPACGLCLRGADIAFLPHGRRAKKIHRRLATIQ